MSKKNKKKTVPLDEMARVLRDHCWSATDDETCGCGWVAPSWPEYLDSESGGALDEATHDHVAHQAAALAPVLRKARREAVLAAADAVTQPGWKPVPRPDLTALWLRDYANRQEASDG